MLTRRVLLTVMDPDGESVASAGVGRRLAYGLSR